MNRREACGILSLIAGAGLAGYNLAPKGKSCNLRGTPLDAMHLHLCAFHVDRNDKTKQTIAHHYCMPLNDHLFQCVVFDSNKPKSRLLGIEYIISPELYATLPTEELRFWHPHAYEVSSGLLTAPSLQGQEEVDFMKIAAGTYGKTFHTWGNLEDSLPLGEPKLQYAFTADRQIDPNLIKKRDIELGISTEEVRKRRNGK